MDNRGSLLFETCVALVILSLGVTSSLKVFSQALFVGTRNEEKRLAASELDHLLFEWFAYPGGVMLPEDGIITLPLEPERFQDRYSVEIRSKNLKTKAEEQEAGQRIRLLKANQYYQVNCRVGNEWRDHVVRLDTVVFKRR